ncbi:predicted protein [Naegleria gruberi]|uniref:Predicted protein n=1 Tax=Naegleria gruberi TaxID=5762 RepID=D2VKR1_NAEGR|nr:uncharacterized protein NAEGRDRAFT_69483 [Naegleria gruberi]EFC42635.1 predicted protein [Naegleria gruberi]|eukprot:XP_002675379.1 predicted protein [Naegleria gruberi strain NEG-M]
MSSSLFETSSEMKHSSTFQQEDSQHNNMYYLNNTSKTIQEEQPEVFKYWKHVKILLKNIFILIYFFSSSLITKIVTMYMAIPNVKISQAPAHDILLSNLTKPIRIAFTLSETITGLLVVILITLSIFNKTHRFSIMSRLLFIVASIMNLRAVCIAVTTFSVPTIEYLQTCGQLQSLKPDERFVRAVNIFGFSGGETCGDYVFSGHATSLSVVCWFVWYYSNKEWVGRIWTNLLLIILHIVGCLGILLAKEHYTVDVLLACTISLLVCQLYHSYLKVASLEPHSKGLFFSVMEFDLSEETENVFDSSIFGYLYEKIDGNKTNFDLISDNV